MTNIDILTVVEVPLCLNNLQLYEHKFEKIYHLKLHENLESFSTKLYTIHIQSCIHTHASGHGHAKTNSIHQIPITNKLTVH